MAIGAPNRRRFTAFRGSDLVVQGRLPQQIAAALNEALGSGAVAWRDGGSYDAQWIQALFNAGGLKPVFVLGDWHRLVLMLGGPVRERMLTGQERAPARHRARADAEDLRLTLAQAMDLACRPVENLADRVAALATLQGPER